MNIGRLIATVPVFLAVILTGPGGLIHLYAKQQEASQEQGAAPIQDEDPVSPFVPQRTRDSQEQDQLAAASMFAHGRLLFQQKKFDQALSRYQRAWRYHPSSASILREIVPLALKLKRNDQAVRYAVIAAEKDPSDIERLQRIAGLLRQQRQFSRALKLYELIDKTQGAGKRDFKYIALQLELGKLYFLTDQPESSARVLEHVREALATPGKYGLTDAQKKQLEGTNGSTYQVIAESMLAAGKPKIAATMFRAAHEIKPDDTLLALRLARALSKQQQPAKALEQLDLFLGAKTSNQGVGPYRLLQELTKQQVQDEAAANKRHLERILALHKEDLSNQPLSFHLAQLQVSQGNPQAALDLYMSLLEAKPSVEAYRGVLSILVSRLSKGLENQPRDQPIQWTKEQQADWKRLNQHLAKFLGTSRSLEGLGSELEAQVFEHERFPTMLLGQLRSQLQLEVNADAEEKNKALTEAADSPEFIQNLSIAAGLIAIRAKEWNSADAFFAKALTAAGKKPAPVLEAWGLQMLMAEQYERSAEALQQAVEHPNINNKRSFYFLLAGAHEMAEQTDKALEAARKAVELSPKLPRIHSRVAWVYYHARRYGEAEQHYQALLKKFGSQYDSADTRDVLRQARLTLSNLCVLQERNAEAEEWLEEVLDEYPEDIGALNDLGYLWADQDKNLHRAVVMIETAVKAEPENAAYRDSLGWVYYRLGQYDAAVKELEIAAKSPDPDSVILDHLGDAYLKANQVQKARSTWQRALKALDAQATDAERNKIQDKLK